MFGISGCIGFLVDVAILYLLKDFLGLYGARVISFICAVYATWSFNRTLTFKNFDSGMRQKTEFFTYFGLMLIGGLINYLIYASLVTFSQLIHELPIIGVAIASVVSMFVNYASSSFLFLRREESKNTLHFSE